MFRINIWFTTITVNVRKRNFKTGSVDPDWCFFDFHEEIFNFQINKRHQKLRGFLLVKEIQNLDSVDPERTKCLLITTKKWRIKDTQIILFSITKKILKISSADPEQKCLDYHEEVFSFFWLCVMRTYKLYYCKASIKSIW